MLKSILLSAAFFALAACGGAQTAPEANAQRNTEHAEAHVDREEQETEMAEADAEHAREVEEIIEDNDPDAVLEAGQIVEDSN